MPLHLMRSYLEGAMSNRRQCECRRSHGGGEQGNTNFHPGNLVDVVYPGRNKSQRGTRQPLGGHCGLAVYRFANVRSAAVSPTTTANTYNDPPYKGPQPARPNTQPAAKST